MGHAPNLLVIGAGLTGLSASMQLRRKGQPHRLLEASAAAGGLARTVTEAGYSFDCTGHLLHLRNPQMAELIRELLGDENLLQIERRSAVYSHGTFTPYPFQANVYGLPKELAFRCLSDFVSAHFQQPKPEIVTFEDYCVAHFGRAMSEAFMVPYNEKVWGVHPRELAATWCERFVPRPTLEEVLRGAVGLPNPAIGYNARFVYPRRGMGMLVDALIERANPVELVTPVSVIDLERRTLRAGNSEVPFDQLLSTMSLSSLFRQLTPLPPEVQQAASELRAVDLHYLDVALNTPVELPYHWVYVPEPEIPFYRVGAYSTFSRLMAPTAKASLYVELASKTAPALGQVLPAVADALTQMGIIRGRDAIRFARLRRLPNAYVLYDSRRERALSVLHAFLSEHRIRSVGRYGAWEYSSMEDALWAGQCAAQALLTEGTS